MIDHGRYTMMVSRFGPALVCPADSIVNTVASVNGAFGTLALKEG